MVYAAEKQPGLAELIFLIDPWSHKELTDHEL